MRFAALALCLSAGALVAQTKLDLGNQAKNADFGAFTTFTRPFRVLGSVPGSCTTGETFFVAPSLYLCAATNTPVILATSGGTYPTYTQSTSDMGEPCTNGNIHSNTAADTAWICNNGTRSQILTDGQTDIVRMGGNNVYTTGVNSFAAASSLILRMGAGLAPTASASVAYDSTANAYRFGVNGAMKTVAFLDSNITGNAATATQLASNPANCSAGTLPRGVDASGVCEGAAAVNLASEVTGTLPAANGGRGITTATDDGLDVWNGSAPVLTILPSCSNTTTSKLLYNTSTNAFSCGTDQGGSPGGSDTQLEYNNAGAFAGTAGLTWNSVLARLRLANTPPASDATEALLLLGVPMTSGSTVGTVIGGSQAVGWLGDFLHFQVNGVSAFRVLYDGSIQAGAAGSAASFWEGVAGTAPASPAAGRLAIFWNGSSLLQDKDSSGTVRTVAYTSSNVATATALATARAIYGNNFDGTAALTQIIASTYGGTGNGFTKFSGPASSEKTFTLPNASSTLGVTVASGAKALATSAISSGACSSAQTDTATGTATTDAVSVTFNADPVAVTGYTPVTTGALYIVAYPTADTVNFKVCNSTASSITPGAITLNWRVAR